jgi:photosystem II stability/assembly factor-like uncharacterized protein
MNRRWLAMMGVGLCVAMATGGCGQRKAKERAVAPPPDVKAGKVSDPAAAYTCEDPLNNIFFVCDATLPGSGAPLIGCAVGASNTILRTTDGGQTWRRVVPRNPASTPFERILFRTPNEGWAMSRDHLLYTGDGGQTWQEAAKLPENFYYFGPCAVNSNRYLQMQPPGCGARIYAASSAGAQWTAWGATLPRNDYEAVFFLDDQHGWLAGNYGVTACTTNGGAAWIKQNIPNGGHLAQIQFVSPLVGWIRPVMGHEGGPWASRDGGATWTKQDAGVKSYNNIVDMQFLNEQTGFLLVSTGRATAEVLQTRDGGATWTRARAFTAPANALCFVSPTAGWLTAGDGTILHCVLGP